MLLIIVIVVIILAITFAAIFTPEPPKAPPCTRKVGESAYVQWMSNWEKAEVVGTGENCVYRFEGNINGFGNRSELVEEISESNVRNIEDSE